MTTSDVTAYAGTATASLILVALLGLPVPCAVLALIVTVMAGGLLLKNWSATAPEIARRKQWEQKAVGLAVCGPGLVAAMAALLVSQGVVGEIRLGSFWVWRSLAIDLVVVFSAFYLSSLVDWCFVVPRLHGLGEVAMLPCQSSTLRYWEGITRVWLGHRIVAYMIGRLGALAAIVFLVARFHPHLSESSVSAIATVFAALAIFYLNRLVPIGGLVTNPPIQVGDKVVLAEEFGTGVVRRPVYYIVDVAIEGVKLLELDEHDQPLGIGLERGHDRSLNLGDVGRLLRGRQRFQGCDEKCCRASKYCPLAKGEPVSEGMPPLTSA